MALAGPGIAGCYESVPAAGLDSDSDASEGTEQPDTAADSERATGDNPIDSDARDSSPPEALHLIGPPLVHAPTLTGFRVNAVLQHGPYREHVRLRIRSEAPLASWQTVQEKRHVGEDAIEWRVTGRDPGTRYVYEIRHSLNHADALLFAGAAVTRPDTPEPFRFVVIADTHVPAREYTFETAEYAALTLTQIAGEILPAQPDFVLHLGDMLDFHGFGFNDPPPESKWTRWGYLAYRHFMGALLGNAAHFHTIGNWDGENGCFTAEERERSRSQRLIYLPGPEPGDYPQGGSADEDYYAFTWGDALFIVLNVMTYTETRHALSEYPGLPDDWTLGQAQLAWLEQTLENATERWRFIAIHHPVGGAGGDEVNSAYGRGGGRAAYVGEQARVHQLMVDHGVQILFYGHDHVFTDMVVDGVHYTLPGSAGASWLFTSAITGYPEGSYRDVSGYGVVDVSESETVVRFVELGGRVLDVISVR